MNRVMALFPFNDEAFVSELQRVILELLQFSENDHAALLEEEAYLHELFEFCDGDKSAFLIFLKAAIEHKRQPSIIEYEYDSGEEVDDDLYGDDNFWSFGPAGRQMKITDFFRRADS